MADANQWEIVELLSLLTSLGNCLEEKILLYASPGVVGKKKETQDKPGEFENNSLHQEYLSEFSVASICSNP